MIDQVGRHVLLVLVENRPGVLLRVVSLISRRGFNIESLSVGPTEDPTRSRITIITDVDDESWEQITKQLNKLIVVHKITDLTNEPSIERELVLFKVNARGHRDSKPVQGQHCRRGQELVDHRGDGKPRQNGRPRGFAARVWHQGDNPHGQDCHRP